MMRGQDEEIALGIIARARQAKALIRSISRRATAEVHYETGGSDG